MSKESGFKNGGFGKEPVKEVPALSPEAELKLQRARFQKWLPDLGNDALDKIQLYSAELLRFNRAVNLISPTSVKTADSVHFADSVLASRLIAKSLVSGAPLYDVGSGNGFPGLIFSILYPDQKVVLIDRDSRKIEFLKHMIGALKLSNTTADAATVEALPAKSVKNMVSRGFAPLHRALLVCRKQVAQGGKYFHMKGDGWANEVASVPSQLFSFWAPALLGQYRLPETNSDMAVVVTDKTAE